MGLDMYISGRRAVAPFAIDEAQHPQYGDACVALAEKAGEVTEVELAYWRKHPNLHGYIVQTFAGGADECQEIPLTKGDLENILEATQTPGSLPATNGFFFGHSDGTEAEDDKEQLTKVIEWLNESEPDVSRSVFYQSSW